MEPERLRQIEQLFHAALEVEKNRQTDFLREACGADESLRREVGSLLAYRSKAENFIEQPAMELAAQGIAEDEVQAHTREAVATKRGSGTGPMYWLPAHVGSYRVLRVLGEGGMGVVYEAEQEQPRRTVALKVIKPGWASPELLRRFDQESRALARLQHPAIAQIHEAGTADTGFGPQPYFAMELIRGLPLREYVQEHDLNTRQRLELMVRICEGVQHAHQRGLIHRDLKPGNILVDETGQPKILDFGVARVTGSDVETTRQTDLWQLVGTLAYMSPEQALGDPLEVDTRSDVYALGVILYELLAGCLPYELSRQPNEAARTIQEEDPKPLSSISRVYRGDIETIVAKALEKDKARRYASASGLAADIQRYLKDEPIAARPPSASYHVWKFARRHRTLVAGVAAVFIALVGGIVASTWEAARASRERDRATVAEQRATRERDRAFGAERAANVAEARARGERNSALLAKQRADTEAATATAINDFLQNDLLAQASIYVQGRSDKKPDPDVKVRTVLDRAAARIEGKFKGQPLVEASIRQTIGKTYMDLGLYPEARRQLKPALELSRRVLGEDHIDTLQTMNNLALLDWYQAKYGPDYGGLQALFTKVLKARRRMLGPEDPDTLSSMSNLAEVYWAQGQYQRAESLLIKLLEVRRRRLGGDHPDTLGTTGSLAAVYSSQQKYAQAEPLLTNLLEVRRRLRGEDHPSTLGTMGTLADLLENQGKYTQAEPLLTKALEGERRLVGEEHYQTLQSMISLARLYLDQGKYDQAEQLDAQVVEVGRRVLGEEHWTTLLGMSYLARVYQGQGKYDQAESLHTRVVETARRALGEDDPHTLMMTRSLADVYRERGKLEQAETVYAKLLEIRRRVMRPQHPETLGLLTSLGALRIQQEHFVDAEPLLREALAGYEKTPLDTWRRYNTQSILGVSMSGQRRYAEAEPMLLSGYQGIRQRETTIPASDRIELERAGRRIVQLYQDWGKPAQAAEWRYKLEAADERRR